MKDYRKAIAVKILCSMLSNEDRPNAESVRQKLIRTAIDYTNEFIKQTDEEWSKKK